MRSVRARKHRPSLSQEDSIRGFAWEDRQSCQVKVRMFRGESGKKKKLTGKLKRLFKVVVSGLSQKRPDLSFSQQICPPGVPEQSGIKVCPLVLAY